MCFILLCVNIFSYVLVSMTGNVLYRLVDDVDFDVDVDVNIDIDIPTIEDFQGKQEKKYQTLTSCISS